MGGGRRRSDNQCTWTSSLLTPGQASGINASPGSMRFRISGLGELNKATRPCANLKQVCKVVVRRKRGELLLSEKRVSRLVRGSLAWARPNISIWGLRPIRHGSLSADLVVRGVKEVGTYIWSYRCRYSY